MLLYLDLDGVLRDFMAGLLACHGLPPENLDRCDRWDVWEVFGMSREAMMAPLANKDFWLGLAPAKDGARLMAEVAKLVFSKEIEATAILTAGAEGEHAGPCFAGNLAWVARHYPGLAQRIVTSPDKSIVARRGAVLIDDRPENCNAFARAGGASILFPRPWNRPIHVSRDYWLRHALASVVAQLHFHAVALRKEAV